jgi:hypothetical protein
VSAKSAILKEGCFECGQFCSARSLRSVSPDAPPHFAFKRALSLIRPNTAVETGFRTAHHHAVAPDVGPMAPRPRADSRFTDTRPAAVRCGVSLRSLRRGAWGECRIRSWHHPQHPPPLPPWSIRRRKGPECRRRHPIEADSGGLEPNNHDPGIVRVRPSSGSLRRRRHSATEPGLDRQRTKGDPADRCQRDRGPSASVTRAPTTQQSPLPHQVSQRHSRRQQFVDVVSRRFREGSERQRVGPLVAIPSTLRRPRGAAG